MNVSRRQPSEQAIPLWPLLTAGESAWRAAIRHLMLQTSDEMDVCTGSHTSSQHRNSQSDALNKAAHTSRYTHQANSVLTPQHPWPHLITDDGLESKNIT